MAKDFEQKLKMQDDLEALQTMSRAREKIFTEVGKVIVGQREVIEQILITLFSKSHCLIVGVPGLAKTLMIRTIGQILDLSFNRVQFTPDLMPADITGTDIIEEDRATGKRDFKFIKGPIFSNILLADEINRTPPKTQAALLQCMQEYIVTAGGRTYDLDLPFFVLATQNPIEQEGTYPLPEAQQDRFMFNIYIGYPTKQDEFLIGKNTGQVEQMKISPVLAKADILYLQNLVRKVPVSDHVISFAVNLVRASRPEDSSASQYVKDYVKWGAGPRAVQFLITGARARAILHSRYNVSCIDVRQIALPILRHRIVPNFNAETEGITSQKIVEKLLQEVPEPKE